jgi:hypothetical protein
LSTLDRSGQIADVLPRRWFRNLAATLRARLFRRRRRESLAGVAHGEAEDERGQWPGDALAKAERPLDQDADFARTLVTATLYDDFPTMRPIVSSSRRRRAQTAAGEPDVVAAASMVVTVVMIAAPPSSASSRR